MNLTILYFFLICVTILIAINVGVNFYFKKKQKQLRNKLSSFRPLIFSKVEVTFYSSSKISTKSTNFFADVIFAKDTLFILKKTNFNFSGQIYQLNLKGNIERFSESSSTFLIQTKKINNNCVVLNGVWTAYPDIKIEITLDFIKRPNELIIFEEAVFGRSL